MDRTDKKQHDQSRGRLYLFLEVSALNKDTGLHLIKILSYFPKGFSCTNAQIPKQPNEEEA